VERRVEKQVEVVPIYEGTVPEGYLSDKANAVLDYETITVAGPASILNQIDHAQIYVNIDGRTSTLDDVFAYTLCDRGGKAVQVNNVELVTAQPGEVNLMLPIQQVKEVQLALNVIYGGGVTESTSRIEMDMDSVQVAGSEAALDGLSEIVLGTVDLSDILESTTLTYPIILPEGVMNVTNVPEVHVSVSFPDLEIREYKVNNLVAQNLPSGLEAQWLTTSVTVRLRGETEVLKNSTAQDISVVVDFFGAEIGAQIYDAMILVDTDAVVGAIVDGNKEG
jgi:YbbR domain-containing protein